MPLSTTTSADIIDALIRDLLGTEPDVLARLAQSDGQVSLRRAHSMASTTDPLDGLDVLARHAIGVALALRSHRGAVSLSTDEQAHAAGWPAASLANTALILGSALHAATDAVPALPVLLEPDPSASRNPLLRAGLRTASVETLLKRLHRPRRQRRTRDETFETVHAPALRVRERQLDSIDARLQDLVGIDARTVEIPSDPWCPAPQSPSARAAHVWAVIALEMIEITGVLQRERIKAVRRKTELDSRLADLPDARVGNLALLLATSLNHELGYTCHVLPADDRPAADLVEAGRRISRRMRDAGDMEAEVVDGLELEDLARSGYVHIGRRAAQKVAMRALELGRLS